MDWTFFAKAAGFDDVCEVNMESLRVMPEVRDMCSADKCGHYGKSWSCPPACGTVEHCAKRIAQYAGGILVQTVGKLEDDYDAAGIAAAHRTHDARFKRLTRQIRTVLPDCLPLGAGCCMRCEVCTYPDKPCRYPGKMLSSMEAYGLLVSDVCTASGMPYYRGEGTITFTSCILIEKKQ